MWLAQYSLDCGGCSASAKRSLIIRQLAAKFGSPSSWSAFSRVLVRFLLPEGGFVMLLRRLGLGSPMLLAVLGVCLFGQGKPAFAANLGAFDGYVPADVCGSCHADVYEEWNQHGHAWMQVHTGGQTPDENLFMPRYLDADRTPMLDLPIQALPQLPKVKNWPTYGQNNTDATAVQLTWADIVDVFGHYKDGEGDLLLTDGRYVASGATGSVGSTKMPARCNKCHNTAGQNPGTGQYGLGSAIDGSWALNGIQCDQCHGRGPGAEQHRLLPEIQVCTDCHSSGDFGTRMGADPAQVGFRLAVSYNIATPNVPAFLANRHPEGDEYRRSPHKEKGCGICHDPHKSVWHDKGGTLYADADGDPGNMCKNCHSSRRVRGTMGEIGMKCTDCHMPEASNYGERMSHIFTINSAATRPEGGANDASHNWKEEPNDTTGALTKYWMNTDGTTGAGDTFLTLDQVCAKCHPKMTLDEMSNFAKFIHRDPGLVDLSINGVDSLLVAKTTTDINVRLSFYPEDAQVGMSAEMWLLAQGPKGWTYWNGTAWKKGMKAWKTGPMPTRSTRPAAFKLAKGAYSYWAEVFPADGSEDVDTVSVYISRK